MSDPIWFRCKGCGKPACYFPTATEHATAGMVGHSKPVECLGTSGTVPCLLYNQLSARTYWRLHEDAERLGPPSEFIPDEK